MKCGSKFGDEYKKKSGSTGCGTEGTVALKSSFTVDQVLIFL